MDVLAVLAQGLWQADHPGADPAGWNKLARKVQIYYAAKAAPIATNIVMLWENI